MDASAKTDYTRALIPHLQRAVQLQLRLAGVDGPPTGSAEILNRLLQGVLLVDAGARVIFANRAAERMLRAGGGLFLGRDGLRAVKRGCCGKPSPIAQSRETSLAAPAGASG